MDNNKTVYDNVVIRNMDASMIYNMSFVVLEDKTEKSIKNIKEQYEEVLSKLLKEQDKDKIVSLVKEKSKLYKLLNSFDKLQCKINTKDNRYYYTGTADDSMMLRELYKYTNDSDFRSRKAGDKTIYYTDVLMNLTFKNKIMIKNGKKKYAINNDNKDKDDYDVLFSAEKLREAYYQYGITINGIKYVTFQRSSSKSRTGNDLFLMEKLHKKELAKKMIEWQRMGIRFEGKQDIVGLAAYESLPSSSIIGEIEIDPDCILLIDDVVGRCEKVCNVVERAYEFKERVVKGKPQQYRTTFLKVEEKKKMIKTAIWDGQSLLDESLFTGKYEGKGFMLLRNNFAKTAAFNTKLQKWFEHNDATLLTDRFGDKYNSDSILMITTKNSMKIFKFTDSVLATFFPNELKELNEIEDINERELRKEHIVWNWYKKKIKEQNGLSWGVCKYEKSSKFYDFQQLTYQVINSLNLRYNDLKILADPSIKHINNIITYPEFLKKELGTKENSKAKETMMLKLLEVNNKITKTKWYKDYRKNYVQDLKRRIKRGKILIQNNDYAVLFGNAYEMLRASIGDKIDSSILNGSECWCNKFADKEELTGFRSPHILASNSALLKNTYKNEFEWFNITNNIVIVNFFGEGAILSNIWNGCDVDSDSVLLGNDPTLKEAVREAIKFNVPINDVEEKTIKYELTPSNMALVDSKLANDYIGRICNFAQQLQSVYYHVKEKSGDEKLLKEIFNDLCILEVLSNIAIDSAKRKYDCNIKDEMSRLKNRYYLKENGLILTDKAIRTVKTKERIYVSETDMKRLLGLNKELSTLQQSVGKDDHIINIKNQIEEITNVEYIENIMPEFFRGLDKNPKIKKSKLSKKPNKSINKAYAKFEAPMDTLVHIINSEGKQAPRSIDVHICDILAEVKYDDVSTNRVRNIEKKCIDASNSVTALFAEQKSKENVNWEDVYEKYECIENDIVADITKFTELTVTDVCKIIRDIYDFRYKVDGKGCFVRDESNNKIIDEEKDKRYKPIIEAKAGGRLLQWLYQANPDLFIKAIKNNTDACTIVQEDVHGEIIDLGKRYKIIKVSDKNITA